MNEDFTPDRSRLKDSMGRYVTQSLFLENGYDESLAIYTLTDTDKEYKGKIYPSLRRLYLECMDPTEYTFANTYLWGWDHWQRICNNKLMAEAISVWREELEVKIRAVGVKAIMKGAGVNFSAAKWIADGKWHVTRGRPSKAELERERKIRQRATEEAGDDSDRIVSLVRRESDDG